MLARCSVRGRTGRRFLKLPRVSRPLDGVCRRDVVIDSQQGPMVLEANAFSPRSGHSDRQQARLIPRSKIDLHESQQTRKLPSI